MLSAALALLLAASSPSPAEAHIDRARELLHAMRYEPALAELGAARSEPDLPAKTRAQIELETGIAEVDLLHDDRAKAAFRAALALDPQAELPAGLSPRIVQTWIEVRAEVSAAGSPKPAVAGDVPAAPASPPLAPAPAAATPTVPALNQAPPAPRRSTLTTVGPFALIGAGVAAGIAGGAFGLRASADHAEAGSAQVQLDAVDDNASARGHATAANVLFAAAGALAVAGVVWLLAR